MNSGLCSHRPFFNCRSISMQKQTVPLLDEKGNLLKEVSPGYARRLLGEKAAEVESVKPFRIKKVSAHELK